VTRLKIDSIGCVTNDELGGFVRYDDAQVSVNESYEKGVLETAAEMTKEHKEELDKLKVNHADTVEMFEARIEDLLEDGSRVEEVRKELFDALRCCGNCDNQKAPNFPCYKCIKIPMLPLWVQREN